ncbi:MAG: capsule assembly Wzi family protein [candidate division KSB1 bacterium]|nr:capsule assembly Wzi family protein [candidate division KSB1 bacterium]
MHNHKIKTLLILCLFADFFMGNPAAQSIYVPLNHWAYELLDRLETKKQIHAALNSTRPMTRDQMISALQRLDPKAVLTPIDQQQIEQLKQAWYMDWPQQDAPNTTRWTQLAQSSRIDPWLPDLIYRDGVHLFSAQTGPLQVYGNPIVIRSRSYATADTLDGIEREFSDGNGVMLWGQLGAFSFLTDVRDTRDYGDRAYPRGNATDFGLGFVQGSKGQMYHDETTAYINYHNNYLDILYGKAKNQWGPGRTGQLMLSDAATSYDQIKLQISLPHLKYTTMLAWLKHYTTDYFFGNAQTKYLAAHRLEFSPWNWLELGLQESIVYAGRTFEPGYLNPVMFFRSAEHYLGDQDNALMGLTWNLKLPRRTRFYGELLIDDMTTGKLGTGYYGNKYAWLCGFKHIDLFSLPNLDLGAEYVRIRPLVYSHKEPMTRYQHFSTPMGYPTGPHTQTAILDLSYRPHYRFQIQTLVQHSVRYENSGVNTGGDINDPVISGGPLYIKFGEGLDMPSTSFDLYLDVQLALNLHIKAGYSYSRGKSANRTDITRRQWTLSFTWNTL